MTIFARVPIGAMALDTPVKALSTNGTLVTLASLFMPITPCMGRAWLSS